MKFTKKYQIFILPTLIFTILFCVNLLYKTKIIKKNILSSYTYQISSVQILDYKSRTLEFMLQEIINTSSNRNINFNMKLLPTIQKTTLNENSAHFKSNLTINLYLDPAYLEKELNKKYSQIITQSIDKLNLQINILSEKDVINNLSDNPIQDGKFFVKCDMILSFFLSQSINKVDENINSFSKEICDSEHMIRSLKTIKLAHLIEKKNNFKVKQISKKIEDETIFKDLPLIFGLTVLLSYYFFKPLRKFLKLNKK